MSGIKHMMDEVAERMDIVDPNDPKVRAEVTRLLGERLSNCFCPKCGVLFALHENGCPVADDEELDEKVNKMEVKP